MDFSPADLFRSTKTGSRSSLDRVNKQDVYKRQR